MENFAEHDFGSNSSSSNFEDGSRDDQSTYEIHTTKTRKYHRHTDEQIQVLESAFKENPHPGENTRLELSNRLGLESRQVKFWFQNRRTQAKTRAGRHDNSILAKENDKLRMENIMFKEAMKNPTCTNCGAPTTLEDIHSEENRLLVENARIKDEINQLSLLASTWTNKPLPSPAFNNSCLDPSPERPSGLGSSLGDELPVGFNYENPDPNFSPVMPTGGPIIDMIDHNISSSDISMFIEYAHIAMDELIKLTQLDGPLWIRNSQGTGESMNNLEYMNAFPSLKHNPLISEGSRANETVMIGTLSLVQTFMDVDQWIRMFPLNIGSASTIHVICAGIDGSINGAMKLMQAEIQVLSPTIPVCEVKFLRFCKQLTEDTWAVVDVSVNTLLDGVEGNIGGKSKRFPSGYVVQDVLNGYSKVTWVEHMEYADNIIHQIYQPLIRSGMVGAHKWVVDLQRQCELFHVISNMSSGRNNIGCTPYGRKSIMELSIRMMRSFATSICSNIHKWELLQVEDETKIMFRHSIGHHGEPTGVILGAISTKWMPVLPKPLFEFLQSENQRVYWDTLSQNGPMQKLLHIPKSQDPSTNNITLLAGNVHVNNNHALVLQDTFTDSFGSYVVHATIDVASMDMVLNGDDSTYVEILPSGFAIVPGHQRGSISPYNGEGCSTTEDGTVGSLLTIGFQVLASNNLTTILTMEHVNMVKNYITQIMNGIQTGILVN